MKFTALLLLFLFVVWLDLRRERRPNRKPADFGSLFQRARDDR